MAFILGMNRSFIFLLIFFIPILLSGQKKISFDQYKNAYKGQPEIVLTDSEKYIIKKDKDLLSITQEKYIESLILDNLGSRNQKDRFYSSELSPVIDYDAYIITTKDKKIRIKDFNESSSDNSAIFYDDVKKIEVTYTGLEPGVRKILNYETRFTDPNLLHRYIFKKQYAAEELKFEVEIDNDIELGYKIINDSGDIKFTKEVKNKKTIYQWIKNNSSAYKWEPNNPGILYNEPHIEIYITDAKIPNKPTFLGDVPKLYSYYQTFVKDLNKQIDQELINIANEVVKDIDEEEEKVKAIYYWVKDNIKYIAYENGYEGFIPREANLVCERKFGDCKDMASIIKAMCNSVGIENVKLTWIGTREIPYSYEEVPTPAVDNHMIACYIKGDEYIFLDATDQLTAYPYPSGFIQGKEAMVGISEKEYKLVKVPIVESKDNLNKIFIDFKIEDDIIKGNGSIEYNGLGRSAQLSRINTLNKKSRFKDIKRRVLLGNNKFNLDNYTEENLDTRDKPYVINYSFTIDNYSISVGNEHFINMFLKKHSVLVDLEEDRISPYEFRHKQKIDTEIIYHFNANESVEELPADFEIDNEVIHFSSHYSLDENKISLEYTIELKTILLEAENFQLWIDSVNKIEEYMENTLTIKHN